MKLYEFQGKELFVRCGIPVPQRILVRSIEEIESLNAPLVLKSQILSGGRGKAGGVVVCNDNVSLQQEGRRLLGADLKGEKVTALLAEEKIDILQEFYLSFVVDGELKRPLIVASAAGGMEIEKIAEEAPQKIIKLPFDPLVGPSDYHFRKVASFLKLDDGIKTLRKVLQAMYALFKEYDASLIEINPLVKTPSGLVALDSKINLDDDAKYRQKGTFQELLEQQKMLADDKNTKKDEGTITYVSLDGNIGLISDGAGTGMLSLDLIRDFGGDAADFCEMGGITSPEVMYKAMETVFTRSETEIKSLLVVLIGGFNRMDEMAEGIIQYLKDHTVSIPFFVRLCGTMEEEGRKMMRDSGLPVFDDLEQAVVCAVKAAEEI
ncbi:ATP-grasp domain-containing protein [Aminobacterium sp. MB27-C1]|jgi:succinyl-CoA synthetase beta subunit|uniref:succinate--CoA ligase subunit beta n=1 Tax=unclassified Aminobacterium TaxID=2685012 RepID=UPI001BCDBDA0|nr:MULTISPECIES: ATP-grasp domain-containing protein [unclassified Aminobacterium]MEA4877651.1 ATP-grasp domain-containing protein [Aminobacterium sp.]WMI70772.1 ATP-grasp domain-containing protein [Aminobacterium sp. MB27-C1]